MNERFSLENTIKDILENERVNKKLPMLFKLQLCDEVKWPFSKMKLKTIMKMTSFPSQAFVDAANFILDRREKGEKISIPIWRGISEEQRMEQTVLIPFLIKESKKTFVLICPDRDTIHLMDTAVAEAAKLNEKGFSGMVLLYDQEKAVEDIARAVRFVRANASKLGIDDCRICIFAAGHGLDAAKKLMLPECEVGDETHRYDELSAVPDCVITEIEQLSEEQ